MKTKSFFHSYAVLLLMALPFCMLSSGCKKENQNAIPFSIDLSNSTYSALNTPGAYLYNANVVIARINATTFAALSEYCTKDNNTVGYNASIGFFVCSGCGGRFNLDGTVAFGPPPKALTKYHTSLSGSILTVSQ